jgi:Outer membrane receptor proteins, mostly Fe transport
MIVLKNFTLYTLFTCFLLFPVFSRSSPFPLGFDKSELTGMVADAKSKQPLAWASISIPDLKVTTATDNTGAFHFKNLPTGSFLVVISYEGYKTISQNIHLNKGIITQNFSLEETATEISDVVVTGTSKATQIKRNPVPIVSVSKEYLTTNISTNAIDAIARIPGVRAVTTGPNVSKPFIRGLGYNRILTLYDGIRQEGQQWGDEHGVEVDQYAIDKVEVIKGPASLSYGSDALAGVVNLIPQQAVQDGTFKGNILLDYQSNNKMLGGSAFLGATKNGFEWFGRVSHKQAADYQNKVDGRVFGTAFNETDANATFGLHKKWGYFHLDFVLYNNLQEIPDGSRDSATWKFTRQITEADTVREIVSDADLNSYKIEPLHQLVQHYRIYSANNFILNNGSRLLLNLGYQRSIRREFSHPEYASTPGLYLQLNSFTYDAKYSLPEIDDWNITFGVNGMYQSNTVTNGTEFVIPSYKQFDVGGFVTVKKTFNNLDIAGGLRYDYRSFKSDGLYSASNPVTGLDMPVYGIDTVGADKVFSSNNKTFTGLSGSIGATYKFSNSFSIKANISRGFRAPNVAEISANGVHPGTNIYQIGNITTPEFSLQEDIGFVYSSKFAAIELNLFNNFITHYIYNQKLLNASGQDSVIVQGNETFKFVSSRANLYGGELSVDVHPYKNLHFENSISAVYATNKGDDNGQPISSDEKHLPFIPPVHGSSELKLDFDCKHINVKHGFAKVEMEYYATQDKIYSAYSTETRTPGYTLFNLGLGGNFVGKNNNTIVSAYLMANNIFDIAYWDHLSRLKYFYGNYQNPGATDNPREHGIYNMGRNISLKLIFPLDFTSERKS